MSFKNSLVIFGIFRLLLLCKASTIFTATSSVETTQPPTTATTQKHLSGLRCADKSNPAYIMPSYCKFSSSTGKLEILKNTQLSFDEILPNAFNELDVKILDLSGLSISKLNFDSFAGLANLNTLYLNNNNIESLPENVFKNLNNLKYLYMDFNQIQKLAPPIFVDTFDLKKVSFSNNKLQNIEKNTFKYQNTLESMSLANNNFETLNNSMFSGLSSLKELNLANNLLSQINNETFVKLPSLSSLNISHNQVESLGENLFLSQPYLNDFDASFNKLKQLTSFSFKECRSLKTIDLKNNNIESIKNNMFQGMDGMDRLDISNNLLTNLTALTFTGLTQLKHLILKNNKIRRLPLGWLDSLGNLESIDLSYNEISTIEPGPFDSPRRMKKIDLSYNKLERVESKWFTPNDLLEVLSLRGNYISTFKSDSFSENSQLSVMDLGNNSLKSESLEKTFINLKSLKVLYLDKNSLSIFDADKASTPATIEKIYLNGSCLEDLRIYNFERLETINLKSNYLLSITMKNIYKIPKLKNLDVSDNNITNIDSSFVENSISPVLLNFSMNGLTTSEVQKLTSISKLSETFVDLSWNQLEDLHNIKNFKNFYIAGNPLECRCEHFSNITRYYSFVDYNKTVCKKDDVFYNLPCYLANKTHCPERSVPPVLSSVCLNPNLDQLLVRPIIYRNSCKYPTPKIDFFEVSGTETGFTVVWNFTNYDSLKWFLISWELLAPTSDSNSTSNATVSKGSTLWPKSKEMNFNYNLEKAGVSTVCVETEPIFVSIQKDSKCFFFYFNGPKSQISTLFPMLTYILIAVGIIFLLIILSIIIAICIKKRKNRKDDEEFLEAERKNRLAKKISVKSIVDPDLPKGIPEQSTVSIDMY